MRVLITGSNGLVGQYLSKLFLEKDIDFLATSRGENRNPFLKPQQYAQMNICYEQTVLKIIEKYRPTSIINTAAMANVDLCETAKKDCWDVNVNALKNLITACIKYDCQLVQFSTDFVFDGLKSTPYKPEDPTNPVSCYGESKATAEKILQTSGLKKWNIVRTIVVYGFLPHMSRLNLVLWVKNNLVQGKKINIVNDQYRMPTYAGDLARGCLQIVRQKTNGIFHLSGSEGFCILDVAKKIASYFDLDAHLINAIASEKLNQTAKRPPKTFFCLEKSKKILGYEPTAFEESLKKILPYEI